MLWQRFVGWLFSFMLILPALAGDAALANKPNLAYTAPMRIEKVDYPADTFTGTHISLKYSPQINRTYISYYDVTHHSLLLAFNPWPQSQGTCNGVVGHWTCLTLDGDGLDGHSADDVGMHSSVDVNTLVAGVSYYDRTHAALKYAEYACFFVCNLAIETIEIGTGQDAGSYGTALKYTNAGVPYIAYSYSNLGDHSQDALKLAHRVSSGGNCGGGSSYGQWQCEVIDQRANIGHDPSIDLYENPGLTVQLAYLGPGNELRYAVSNVGKSCGPGTASKWFCSSIDLNGGGDVSISSYNTIPSIAYYDPVGGNLRYASFIGPVTDANCGRNIASQYVWRCDAIELVGKNRTRSTVSLAFDDSGYPAIAYQNFPADGPTTLKIARPLNAYHYDVGNCGPVPLFEPIWLCSTVDGGSAYTNEAAFAAIDLRSNGLATIAFTEDDGYHSTQRLMVAMQQTYAYMPLIKK